MHLINPPRLLGSKSFISACEASEEVADFLLLVGLQSGNHGRYLLGMRYEKQGHNITVTSALVSFTDVRILNRILSRMLSTPPDFQSDLLGPCFPRRRPHGNRKMERSLDSIRPDIRRSTKGCSPIVRLLPTHVLGHCTWSIETLNSI